MKKNYLFTLAAGLICTLTAHAQETALPDSLYSYDENNQLFSKVYYQYNDKGKLTSQENFSWNSETETWVTGNIFKYEYDEEGRYMKADITFPTSSHQEGVYTSDGNYFTKFWTTTSLSDGTVSTSKGSGEYDDLGNIVRDTTCLSNGNDSWYISGIQESTYDTESRQTSYILTSYDIEGKITGVSKGSYTYTGNDYLFEYSYQSDNFSTGYKTKTETTPGNPAKVDYYRMEEGETEWTYLGPDYKYYPSSNPDANTQIHPESTVKVYGTDGAIRIEVAKAALVEVYNVSGQRLYAQVVDGTINIPVATGIYIVRAANEVTKVSIRK